MKVSELGIFLRPATSQRLACRSAISRFVSDGVAVGILSMTATCEGGVRLLTAVSTSLSGERGSAFLLWPQIVTTYSNVWSHLHLFAQAKHACVWCEMLENPGRALCSSDRPKMKGNSIFHATRALNRVNLNSQNRWLGNAQLPHGTGYLMYADILRG